MIIFEVIIIYLLIGALYVLSIFCRKNYAKMYYSTMNDILKEEGIDTTEYFLLVHLVVDIMMPLNILVCWPRYVIAEIRDVINTIKKRLNNRK